jgi:protein-S-isoprenylcysteine O-methyltransferase Ste14
MRDHPGVKFPPPIVYAVAVLGGWWLNRFWPLPVRTVAGGTLAVLAWALAAAALVLLATPAVLFIRNHTSILPMRPSSALVAAGPYRFTRNPMYLGMALLTMALGLWLNTWWIIVLLMPALLIVQRFVIAREEAYLRRRFGAEYDAYTRQVRRWV